MASFSPHPHTSLSQQDSQASQRKPSLRVMIVDDHEIFRHGLRDLVNSISGFRVVGDARSARQALSLAQNTPVDVILLDISLPDENGLSVTRQLKQLSPSPSIIILSATMTHETLLDAVLAGADGYLTKDIPAADIVHILQGFLEGAPAMLPPVATRLIHQLVKKCNELTWRCNNLEAELLVFDLNDAKNSADPISSAVLADTPGVAIHSSSALQSLTPQEEKVFQLMRQGQSNKDIATHLSISHYTVGKHVQNILRK
ncbi:MAG TPA: response regulator transcription factor, partial [Ktedonobacteraceae bacterium]|nr:response regulator transcription factor [Ktedonobacteraceae bacterium]